MIRFAIISAILLCVAPARAEVADDPLAYIAAIYKVYQQNRNDSGVGVVYSRRMQALRDADAAKGDAGTIDWDLFVNGSDWVLTNLRISLEERSATQARVRARFANIKQPEDISFDLVREGGHWAIDDITSSQLGRRWDMRKILTGAPDAFPDEKK